MAFSELGQRVWYDGEGTGYIGLDLTADIAPPEPRTVGGVVLAPKGEYHCSLVAVRRYTDDPAQEVAIVAAVKEHLRKHDLRYAGLGPERYLCRKDDRMTVIAPVVIDGIDELVDFLRTRIPGLRAPFPHVTLLKNSAAEFGIAVHSTDDLDQYCQKLTD